MNLKKSGVVETIENNRNHWSIRDNLHIKYEEDDNHLAKGKIGFHWDFQERPKLIFILIDFES